MKTKKRLRSLMTMVVMVMAFAVTGIISKAATITAVPVPEDDYEIWEKVPDSRDLNVIQTSETEDSVTISWNALAGVSGYLVELSNYNGATENKRVVVATTDTKITIKLEANEKYTYSFVLVYPCINVNNVNYYLDYNHTFDIVYPLPAKADVKGLDVLNWNPTKSKMNVYNPKNGKEEKKNYTASLFYNPKTDYYPDGYKFTIYDLKDKKIKTVEDKNIWVNVSIKSGNLKKCWNKGFKYDVAGYKVINGKRVYGKASSKKVFIPQATLTKYNSTTIKWTKVSGAKGYYIYLSTDYGKKYKKVKKVGKNTTSAKISGYKPSPKNLKKGAKYRIYVIPYDVKVGKKKYKGMTTTIYTYSKK